MLRWIGTGAGTLVGDPATIAHVRCAIQIWPGASLRAGDIRYRARGANTMTVGSQLQQLLRGPRVSYLLEAHDACSGLIAQEAGFPGVWASSLTLSCAAGLRDDSEISTEHVLYTLEAMADRLAIPVLFDGDSGHGGFNQFRILVHRLCRRGLAGVCIEDKLFPKSNSFVDPGAQKLTSVDEFVGKLRAGLDARTAPDFVIIARTEALIVGAGMAEALRRAHAYADAGVDAVLIHSKARTFDEVQAFCAAWDRPTPVVCVPTTYPDTTRAQLEASGVRIAIWANHMLRAAVRAMQQFAARLRDAETPLAAEVASLDELFRLQDVAELRAARLRYEPGAAERQGGGAQGVRRDLNVIAAASGESGSAGHSSAPAGNGATLRHSPPR